MTASTSATANSVAAGNITGTLTPAQLPPSLVTNSETGVNLSGTFSGNGGALSNLSVTALTATSTNLFITSWGDNQYGQRLVPAGLDDVVALGVGVSHSLALRASGTIVAWGRGQIYAPSNGVDYGQAMVPAGLSNVMGFAAGYLHNLAFRTNGTIVGWGAGTAYTPPMGLIMGKRARLPG